MADKKALSIENLIDAISENNTKMKDWIATQISNIKIIDILWVDELPTTNISTNTIYMVKNEENSKTINNVYDEYVYKENTGWEMLGQVDAGSVDLSNYYTKTQIDTILNQYVKQNQIHKHNNKDILDKLSDVSGILNYDGTPVHTEVQISKDGNNALEKRNDGLYVPKENICTEDEVKKMIEDLWNKLNNQNTPSQKEYNFMTNDNLYINTYDNYIFIANE